MAEERRLHSLFLLIAEDRASKVFERVAMSTREFEVAITRLSDHAQLYGAEALQAFADSGMRVSEAQKEFTHRTRLARQELARYDAEMAAQVGAQMHARGALSSSSRALRAQWMAFGVLRRGIGEVSPVLGELTFAVRDSAFAMDAMRSLSSGLLGTLAGVGAAAFGVVAVIKTATYAQEEMNERFARGSVTFKEYESRAASLLPWIDRLTKAEFAAAKAAETMSDEQQKAAVTLGEGLRDAAKTAEQVIEDHIQTMNELTQDLVRSATERAMTRERTERDINQTFEDEVLRHNRRIEELKSRNDRRAIAAENRRHAIRMAQLERERKDRLGDLEKDQEAQKQADLERFKEEQELYKKRRAEAARQREELLREGLISALSPEAAKIRTQIRGFEELLKAPGIAPELRTRTADVLRRLHEQLLGVAPGLAPGRFTDEQLIAALLSAQSPEVVNVSKVGAAPQPTAPLSGAPLMIPLQGTIMPRLLEWLRGGQNTQIGGPRATAMEISDRSMDLIADRLSPPNVNVYLDGSVAAQPPEVVSVPEVRSPQQLTALLSGAPLTIPLQGTIMPRLLEWLRGGQNTQIGGPRATAMEISDRSMDLIADRLSPPNISVYLDGSEIAAALQVEMPSRVSPYGGP